MNLIWTTALPLQANDASVLKRNVTQEPLPRYSIFRGLGNLSAIRIGWSAFLIGTGDARRNVPASHDGTQSHQYPTRIGLFRHVTFTANNFQACTIDTRKKLED
jgi:hypothetical protein